MATGVMADHDNIKVESEYTNSDDVIERAMKEDPELNDIINKLDSSVSLDADHHLRYDEDDDDYEDDGGSSVNADSDSISTTSSFKENDEQNHNGLSSFRGTPESERRKNGLAASSNSSSSNGNTAVSSSSSSSSQKLSPTSSNGNRPSPSPSKESLASRDSGSTTTSDGGKKKPRSGIRNSLRALKKLTKFADKEDPKKKESRRSFNSEFTAVVVDRLPQVFVVKYLGYREVQGMFGLHHVRRPVDEMVKVVKTNMEEQPQTELPLLYVVVSPKGLDIREHKRNKVKKGYPPGLMPIDFISYGVQDIKYWRVFTCIVVRELSSRSRLASCHAFLCDSSHSGRKMALALGAAFNVYSKKLKTDGKSHNFQVELRPPDELADAVDAECEA